MLKLMYFAKRKPGFTRDEFTRRWRMHGARGMSVKFWRHALCYSQAEPIVPVPIAGGSDFCDGVAYTMVADEAFTSGMDETDRTEGAMMSADEEETFATHIMPDVILWVNEEKIIPGEPGGMTAFLCFNEEAKAREAAELCRKGEGINRLTLNVKNPDAEKFGVRSGLPFEAVVEVAVSSLRVMEQLASAAIAPALAMADEVVYTREAVLWDRVS